MERFPARLTLLAALALCALAFTACSAASEDYLAGVDDVVVAELERLSVEPTADAKISQLSLPADLSGPQWGPVESACAAGGYDLATAAGLTVTMTAVDIAGACQGEAVTVRVVSQGDAVACAYLSVREGSNMAPGIWAVNDPSCSY